MTTEKIVMRVYDRITLSVMLIVGLAGLAAIIIWGIPYWKSPTLHGIKGHQAMLMLLGPVGLGLFFSGLTTITEDDQYITYSYLWYKKSILAGSARVTEVRRNTVILSDGENSIRVPFQTGAARYIYYKYSQGRIPL